MVTDNDLIFLKDPESLEWTLYTVNQYENGTWYWTIDKAIKEFESPAAHKIHVNFAIAKAVLHVTKVNIEEELIAILLYGEKLVGLPMCDLDYLLWCNHTKRFVHDDGWKNSNEPPILGRHERWIRSVG